MVVSPCNQKINELPRVGALLHHHLLKRTARTDRASLGPPEKIVGPVRVLAYIGDADCIAGS
jgi:hypothetical protein